MKRIMILGLSAACTVLAVEASVSATEPAVPAPAYGPPGAGNARKLPDNFDANLAASRRAAAQKVPDRRAGRGNAPLVIGGGAWERLRPAPIVTDHYDAGLRRPAFLWAGKQAGSSIDFVVHRQGKGALGYARAYLHEFASRLNVDHTSVDEAEPAFVHDDDKGAVIVRFQQRVNGLEVMNRQLNVVMNQDLELIAISGYFADARVAAHRNFSDDFRAGPTAAMDTAFGDLGLPIASYGLYDSNHSRAGFAQFAPASGVSTAAVGLTAPVGVKQVLFPVGEELLPGYLLIVQAGQAGSRNGLAYAYVVSADGSRLLFRQNMVAQDSYTYRVFADDGTLHPDDSPFGNELIPHPTGNPDDTLEKHFGEGTLVTVGTGSQGIEDAWLPMPDVGIPVDNTITQGNNVWAYADIAGGDGRDSPLDAYGRITAAGVFDHLFDPDLQPANLTNQQAAIVNLFYLNNWLHDAWYAAGFTEAVGNAQVSNYGRGGAELDPVFAEAQDQSGRNNANMATPPDGFVPRMQMYIFDNGQVEIQRVEITAPTGIAQILEPTGGAGFGVVDYPTVRGDVVIYDDGSTADETGGTTGTVTDGCQAAVNGSALVGHIALIDRGACAFITKAANAEAAGAIAALIVNNEPGDTVIDMGGTNPAISIPSLMISNHDGGIIKDELITGSGAVTVEMERSIASDRDASFDSQIVAHEFFHYVSNRLVGDASGLFNMQGGGMGEGWSDAASLLLTARDADLATMPDGAYSVGGYATDDFYHSIRRFPYSTDMTRNPLTFGSIVDFPEVHAIGEIWAVPLWEAFVGLYNHYEAVDAGTALTEAKTRMMGYLVEGLMATPNAPTMIEARDALLAVIQAADATDYGIFVTAFAKRGMGWGAMAPPRESFDMTGVVESFETDLKTFVVQDAAFEIDAATVCDADPSLDPGETGRVTIDVLNTGAADLPGVTAELSSTNDLTFSNDGVLAFAPDPVPMFGGTGTATGTVMVNTSAAGGMTDIDIRFPDLGGTADEVEEPAAIQLRFLSNQDFAHASFRDDVETAGASLNDWARTRTGSGIDWKVDSEFSADLGLPADNDYWHGVDNASIGTTELATPPIVLGSAPFSVGFYHYYQFEAGPFANFDGGVLEINIDGTGWQDVVAAGGTFAVGYNGTITVTGAGNPLEGRPGFVRVGGGGHERISFGSALAGRTVQLRFRTGSDVVLGDLGWIVDDIVITGAAAPMFSSPVAENGACGDAPPVANAGANQDVGAGATVMLDGSASSDDGGSLAYSWTQVGGATVALSDPAAAQPTFTADTASYTFLLTVTDDSGQTAADSVTVNVTGSAPVADAGTDQSVAAAAIVKLDGSRSASSDFGTLSYAWTQSGGASVNLSGDTTVQPTFTAPFGTASYAFLLTVTDEQGRTASDEVTVSVTDAAPAADAGADQSVASGATVTLDGSGSGDAEGSITWAWTQTAGESVVLSDPTAAQPSFTAPSGDGAYSFELTVTDQGAQTASDTVTVTVQDDPPTADAGVDQSVRSGAIVILDGSGSGDAGGTITYAWTQTAGDSVTLSDATAAQPSFTAPPGDGVYTFELTVTDQSSQTASDAVTVTVRDDPPIADAGPDRSVNGGATVILDGSGSGDAEGTITWAWMQTAGQSVTLSDAAAAQPSFTAPDADVTLTFDLTVTDEGGETDTDSVTVTVARQGSSGDDTNASPVDPGDGGGSGGGSIGLWLLGALLGWRLLRRRPCREELR